MEMSYVIEVLHDVVFFRILGCLSRFKARIIIDIRRILRTSLKFSTHKYNEIKTNLYSSKISFGSFKN